MPRRDPQLFDFPTQENPFTPHYYGRELVIPGARVLVAVQLADEPTPGVEDAVDRLATVLREALIARRREQS